MKDPFKTITEEKRNMSVYIGQHDALEKMAEVEGSEWKRLQENDPNPNCSFPVFFSAWEREYAGKTELMREGVKMNCFVSSESGDSVIYGWNGWNRYAVRCDGAIFFIRDQARDHLALHKAVDVGFDVL